MLTSLMIIDYCYWNNLTSIYIQSRKYKYNNQYTNTISSYLLQFHHILTQKMYTKLWNLKIKILNFLINYDTIITPEDSEMMYSFLSIVKDFKCSDINVKMETNRGHFLDCPWSDDDCKEGPDNCRCIWMSIRSYQINNLINYYKKLVK